MAPDTHVAHVAGWITPEGFSKRPTRGDSQKNSETQADYCRHRQAGDGLPSELAHDAIGYESCDPNRQKNETPVVGCKIGAR